MFVIVAVIAVVLVAALFGIAATKSNTFHVQRAASIKAAPEKIFPLINDFRDWAFWSPWEKVDPTMKRTYSGAASGEGAVYEWDGNKKVGKGRMEITGVTSPSKVAIKLDFIRPFEGHNTAEFTLEPLGEATNVVWSMQGPMAFVPKLFSVFVSMDRMIGKEFEAGLVNLKAVSEK